MGISFSSGGGGGVSDPRPEEPKMRVQGVVSNQDLATNNVVELSWGESSLGSVIYDVGDGLASDGSRYTVQEDGIYHMGVRVALSNVNQGRFLLFIKVDGQNEYITSNSDPSDSFSGPITLHFGESVKLESGNEITFEVDGGDADIDESQRYSSLSITKISELP